jgi:hypothetical protein
VEVVHLPSRERAIADRPQAVVIFAGDLGHRGRSAVIAYEQQQCGTIGHMSVLGNAGGLWPSRQRMRATPRTRTVTPIDLCQNSKNTAVLGEPRGGGFLANCSANKAQKSLPGSE